VSRRAAEVAEVLGISHDHGEGKCAREGGEIPLRGCLGPLAFEPNYLGSVSQSAAQDSLARFSLFSGQKRQAPLFEAGRRSIEDHDSSDLLRVQRRVAKHMNSAHGVPDQDQRPGQMQGLDDSAKLAGDLSRSPGRPAWRAPAEPRSVERQDACRGRQARPE
jgi:hypothetical protein